MLLAGCTRSPYGPNDGLENLPPDTDFPVSITALSLRVGPGNPVPLSIENHSTVSLAYSFCIDGTFERWTRSGWAVLPRVPPPCPNSRAVFDPGTRSPLTLTIPSDAPEGIYRLRVTFVTESRDQTIIRRSNEFAVD
jgi:hypothetical protein